MVTDLRRSVGRELRRGIAILRHQDIAGDGCHNCRCEMGLCLVSPSLTLGLPCRASPIPGAAYTLRTPYRKTCCRLELYPASTRGQQVLAKSGGGHTRGVATFWGPFRRVPGYSPRDEFTGTRDLVRASSVLNVAINLERVGDEAGTAFEHDTCHNDLYPVYTHEETTWTRTLALACSSGQTLYFQFVAGHRAFLQASLSSSSSSSSSSTTLSRPFGPSY